MHFTTLFILKNETLDNIKLWDIEDEFGKRFCYSCGESTPKYRYWCDWFQIGGRWADLLKAKRGIFGERSCLGDKNEPETGLYSIVEIKDLTAPLDTNSIYAVATKSRIYQKSDEWTCGKPNEEKFNKLIDDINNKRFKGVIALIDCHD